MNKIYLLGDIHGNIMPIYKLNKVNLCTSDIVIFLGDVGLNYYLNERDFYTKRELSNFPCKFYCLRGNHEERPSNLSSMKTVIEAGGPMYQEEKFPNIYYFSDTPEEYHIGGYNILTLPGAYSVDKQYRLANHWKWFPQEQISKQEWENFLPFAQKQYDVILSHTCPYCWEPRDLFLNGIDQSQVDDTMEKWFQEFEYNHIYKFWFWGHFHKTRVYPEHYSTCAGQPIMLYNDAYLDLDEAMFYKLTARYPGEAIYDL